MQFQILNILFDYIYMYYIYKKLRKLFQVSYFISFHFYFFIFLEERKIRIIHYSEENIL